MDSVFTVIVDVGFILTATAFFTKVFGLKGYWSLVAAFVVGVLTVEYPVFLTAFPALSPWLDPILKVIAAVIAAAGTYDFSKDMAKQSAGQ